jgi:uncharacterized protein YraI
MRLLKRLFAGLVIVMGSAGLAFAYPASVTDDLNLRTGPGTQYPVITVIPGGAPVHVRSCSAGWCAVTYQALQGHVSQRYLAPHAPPPAVAPPPFVHPPPAVVPRPPWRDRVCRERGARWALGRWASPRVIEEARRGANARRARVVRPGEFYTMEFDPRRLTIEVDRRNRIVDLRCG